MGITRVRPLLGGFNQWKRLGYPLEDAADRIGWHSLTASPSILH
jgi:3-mercaptopyruvate sulfurtransferase SseA